MDAKNCKFLYLGECCGVTDGKGYIEYFGKGSGEERFSFHSKPQHNCENGKCLKLPDPVGPLGLQSIVLRGVWERKLHH